ANLLKKFIFCCQTFCHFTDTPFRSRMCRFLQGICGRVWSQFIDNQFLSAECRSNIHRWRCSRSCIRLSMCACLRKGVRDKPESADLCHQFLTLQHQLADLLESLVALSGCLTLER